MKKLTILAAVLLAASAANAQDLIKTRFARPTEGSENPVTDRGANPTPAPLTPGTFGTSYSDYNQDACIVQAGSTNYSLIKQTDNRTGDRTGGSGSSAYISQSGSLNNAYQTQTLDATSNSDQANSRNLLRATQDGTASRSDQTQTGGFSNTAEVNQGAGTSENRAIQTQTGGNTNSALINQTNAVGYAPSASNRAEQVQTGSDETAEIGQQGSFGYAKQTQSGFSDHAYIGQGAPGMHNTAIQTQSGEENVAKITQSVNPPTVGNDYNYAQQNQSGYGDQANIDQHGSHNFAQQEQAGSFVGNDPNNESSITQSHNYNGAYTGQTGVTNTSIIVQQ